MKKIFFHITALLLLVVFSYSSCKKEESKDENAIESTASVEENALAEETFTDIFSSISGLSFKDDDDLFSIGKGKRAMISIDDNDSIDDPHGMDCASITASPAGSTWPKTVTVDFGTGCTKEGITKKGKIIAVFSNDFRMDNSKIDISFDGFYVNNQKVEGAVTLTNKGENDADNHVFEVKIVQGKITGTKTISWSSTKTVTVDFGTGCTKEGITKKGKIIAVFSNDFRMDNSKIDISFDGFYVNNQKVEGAVTVTNKGENDADNYVFEVKIVQGKITGTKTISWSSTKTIEWVKGINKQSPLDDNLRVSGTAAGTNSAGKNFTVNITKNLVRPIICPFFTEGILEIKQGDNTLTLNYGEGSCDNEAMVTVNGKSKEIELKK